MHALRSSIDTRIRTHVFLLAALATGLAACGGSSSSGGQSGNVGEQQPKPGGGFFYVDPNHSGSGSRLHLAELNWGRLVDVHEIDAAGEVVPEPLFVDLVIEQEIESDGSNYRLERDPVSQEVRLVILAQKTGAADPTNFDQLLEETFDDLPVITPKNDDTTEAPPFSLVPRNACIVLRFDDCLDDSNADPDVRQVTGNVVQVLTGYPPIVPYMTRIVFDTNFGGVVGGKFRTTRVLIDTTVSEFEAQQDDLLVPPPVNGLGLPGSLVTSETANVSVRIPTRTDPGSGQFDILTNLSGIGLDLDENDPVDPSSPTADVVRAARSGNEDDPNNGFLKDRVRPQVLGTWSLTVDDAEVDPDVGADPEFDFVVDVTFSTVCSSAPEAGDVITMGSQILVVSQDGTAPDPGGQVLDVHVRTLEAVADPADLEGDARFVSPYDPALTITPACWVSFTPAPLDYPAGGVSTSAQLFVRFTEPMDPASLSPFENFLLVNGPSTPGMSTATTSNISIGQVLGLGDLDTFSTSPLLRFPHVQGMEETIHLELAGPTDLAGNLLGNELAFVDFTLNAQDIPSGNGSVVLRFNSTDEVGDDGLVDLRGQYFPDLSRGVVAPRPVSVTGWQADRSNPVPANMTAIPGGVFTPLNPLGAKLQTVWRYCDLGWDIQDETKYNLDVIGLNWSPIGGQVVPDFYPNFEIRLGHSRFLPDEDQDMNGLPMYPASGLQGSPNFFEDNYLSDPMAAPQVVHNRSLGYRVQQANVFIAPTQTPMLPYPLNRGSGLDLTYTWRDTAVLGVGGPNGAGAPTAIESTLGLLTGGLTTGAFGGPGLVPTLGLPLLIEIRCFPSDAGVGLNLFDISIANALSSTPNFRAYSSGGVNGAGQEVVKNPDLETIPSGGFNPLSTPPGQPTMLDADNVFYLGQLDTVVRVSRVHTIWLDTGVDSPDFVDPVLEPSPDDQPTGTEVILDYRGATGFTATGSQPFDGSMIDAYGNTDVDTAPQPNYFNGVSTWTGNINALDGAKFIQLRLTFVNNLQTGLAAELSALGIPFRTD